MDRATVRTNLFPKVDVRFVYLDFWERIGSSYIPNDKELNEIKNIYWAISFQDFQLSYAIAYSLIILLLLSFCLAVAYQSQNFLLLKCSLAVALYSHGQMLAVIVVLWSKLTFCKRAWKTIDILPNFIQTARFC